MSHTVTLAQESGYRFANRFGEGLPPVHADEPPPLGTGTGPSPDQLLAAAVGNCLCASLVFALRKFHLQAEPICATVVAHAGRNEQKRMRIQRIEATITLGVAGEGIEHLDRVLATFEDYCTVTASVRAAIPVEVAVLDATGQRLK